MKAIAGPPPGADTLIIEALARYWDDCSRWLGRAFIGVPVGVAVLVLVIAVTGSTTWPFALVLIAGVAVWPLAAVLCLRTRWDPTRWQRVAAQSAVAQCVTAAALLAVDGVAPGAVAAGLLLLLAAPLAGGCAMRAAASIDHLVPLGQPDTGATLQLTAQHLVRWNNRGWQDTAVVLAADSIEWGRLLGSGPSYGMRNISTWTVDARESLWAIQALRPFPSDAVAPPRSLLSREGIELRFRDGRTTVIGVPDAMVAAQLIRRRARTHGFDIELHDIRGV